MASLLVAFYPMASEADILPLLRQELDKRTVCLVRTPASPGELLEACRWDGQASSLESHPRLPLLQVSASLPSWDLSPWAMPPSAGSTEFAGIALIPGAAFAENGGRLGRGKGWYDRFLATWPGLLRVGVCFNEQIAESLPEESWDIRMDWIACPDRLIKCAGRISL